MFRISPFYFSKLFIYCLLLFTLFRSASGITE